MYVSIGMCYKEAWEKSMKAVCVTLDQNVKRG